MGRILDHLLVNSHLAKIREQQVGKLAGESSGNSCNSFMETKERNGNGEVIIALREVDSSFTQKKMLQKSVKTLKTLNEPVLRTNSSRKGKWA